MLQTQIQLSKNFSLNELQASQTALRYGISNLAPEAAVGALKDLVEHVLQPLRDTVGVPIKISSGYRSPALNKKVGGVAGSQHVLGQAADITVKGFTTLEVCKIIIDSGIEFDQLINESNWVHVSYNKLCNRKQVLTANFDNEKVSYVSGLCS